MYRRSVDLFATIAIALVAVALTFVMPSDIVIARIWVLPLVFLLPGYALTAALFARRIPEIVERITLSLGLSLVIVVLCGLVLNWTPFGLNAHSWAVLLGSITVGVSVIALVRRRGRNALASEWFRVGRIGFTVLQGWLLGLAALIVCAAVILSIIGAENQPYPGFTQLWMLPGNGASVKNTVRLGVNNMEATGMEYRLNVNINGKIVKEWPAIELNPNENWQVTFVLPSSKSTGIERVEADLYRADKPGTPYHYVVLWINP